MRDSIPEDMRSKYKLQCYPLYHLLLALDNPRVDFLSLDIEGAELAVLKTIPWDKVDIELVMIEINHSDKLEIQKEGFRNKYFFISCSKDNFITFYFDPEPCQR